MLAIYDEIRVNRTSLRVVGKEGPPEATLHMLWELEEPRPRSVHLLHEFLQGDARIGILRSNSRLSGHSLSCQCIGLSLEATSRMKIRCCSKHSHRSGACDILVPPEGRSALVGHGSNDSTYGCSCESESTNWSKFVPRIGRRNL